MSRPLLVSRSSSLHHTAFLALPLLVALGCSDTRQPTAPDGSMPQHVLSDGSTDGAYKGFLFLPPLVADPDKGGQTPIPGLAPHAKVCVLDRSVTPWVCKAGEPFRDFASSAITFDVDHYKLLWDTKDANYPVQTTLDSDGNQITYRLTVFLGSKPLGFVDLQFGATGGTAKNLSTNDVVGLKDGRTVPVNFMIGSSLETDLGCFTGHDCRLATFTAGEEVTILTRDGDAVLFIPGGATSGTGTILARIAELPGDKCNLGVAMPWYNSCYEYDLFPKQVFSEAVTVGQCIHTGSVPPGRLAELQLGARHHDPSSFELLPNVAAPAGLSCGDYVPAQQTSGLAAALKDAGRNLAGLLFGTPVHAGHSGLGGTALALSTVAWVDPGLRVAGFDANRGGFSSVSSAALRPAMQALETTYSYGNYLNVWYDVASTLDATLLDGDVDVVILGTVRTNTSPITALTVDEQSALLEYVTNGGCAILLADNNTFGGGHDAVNESLIDAFGLDITGTLAGMQTATVVGSSAAVDGIVTFKQNVPGWFNGFGQGTVQAKHQNGTAAMVEFAAGAFGPNSGPVFAFSDANAFFASNYAGLFGDGANRQLFLNTVNACGTEPLPQQ